MGVASTAMLAGRMGIFPGSDGAVGVAGTLTKSQ